MALELNDLLPLFREFRNGISKITSSLQRMRQECYKDGVVLAKNKIMGALLISVYAKCEPCIQYYAEEARGRGVTCEELLEYLGVAVTMGGCVGEVWALKAYADFQNTGHPSEPDDGDHCCAS